MKIDQIIRSRRRTVALIVEPDGRLVVRAPLHARQADIERLVAYKADWIERKRAQFRLAPQAAPRRRFQDGERFPYLGQEYPLQIAARQSSPLVFDEAFHLAHSALPQASQVFEAWYRRRGRELFTQRAAHFAHLHGLRYTSVRLSSARTRWGSCGAKGSLNFNWRLVMAPPDVIDYVIIHELAHLVERNHSPRFWARVAAMMPDYKVQRSWLKTHSASLSWP
jgi:hypothetical protein